MISTRWVQMETARIFFNMKYGNAVTVRCGSAQEIFKLDDSSLPKNHEILDMTPLVIHVDNRSSAKELHSLIIQHILSELVPTASLM